MVLFESIRNIFRKKPRFVPILKQDSEDQKQATDLLFAAMNAQRVQRGLPAFIRDSRLDVSAQRHCDTMVETNIFSHRCPGEPEYTQRIINAGYTPWDYVYENIAAGQSSADEVVAEWMDESPPNDWHRRAILGYSVHVGCGFSEARGTTWVYYWTADFGHLKEA